MGSADRRRSASATDEPPGRREGTGLLSGWHAHSVLVLAKRKRHLRDPNTGGRETKIVDKAFSPRFSPDGQWIAYQEGESAQGAKIFIVPSSGGQPKQIVPEFATAYAPQWSPDGKYLLMGSFHPTDPPTVPPWDWWACPIDGGKPVKTGVYKPMVDQGVRSTTEGDWERGFFYLRGGANDGNGNVWRIPLSEKTLQVSGPPERLMAGTGDQTFLALARRKTSCLRISTRS